MCTISAAYLACTGEGGGGGGAGGSEYSQTPTDYRNDLSIKILYRVSTFFINHLWNNLLHRVFFFRKMKSLDISVLSFPDCIPVANIIDTFGIAQSRYGFSIFLSENAEVI